MMKLFKAFTILALAGSLVLDYYNGYPISWYSSDKAQPGEY